MLFGSRKSSNVCGNNFEIEANYFKYLKVAQMFVQGDDTHILLENPDLINRTASIVQSQNILKLIPRLFKLYLVWLYNV